ncbi:MAG TPA: c-type cytochrome [Tepidisphaeraceae bacterium]|nr:c-type cytochrome [Tepidisphaeraceae bacterium]
MLRTNIPLFVACFAVTLICLRALPTRGAEELTSPARPFPSLAAPAPVPPLADAPAADAAGLRVTFEAGGKTDARTARLVALHVPAGRPPTPFLPPGPFKATWAGDVNLRFRGEFSFAAEGRGAVRVFANDAVAFEAAGDDLATASPGPKLKLKKGKTKLRVEYASPADGDARLRLTWVERTWPPEPPSPSLLTHDSSDKLLREQQRLREGRALFAELRCVKCHTPPGDAPAGAMPELAKDAPSLDAIGQRLRPEWVADWVHNPRQFHPTATMPKLALAPADAVNVAAYLATIGQPLASDPGPMTDEHVGAGGRLFTGLGCVACHTAPDAPDAAGRTPLWHVRDKYRPHALRQYLLKPEAHYAWTRMPNFALSDAEATDLAAYLTTRGRAIKRDAATGDVDRGRAVIASSGCVNCHAVPGQATTLSAPPLADVMRSEWTSGCVADDAAKRKAAPDFSLADDQRAALRAFAAAGLESLNHDEPAEAAEWQIAASNCLACHAQDKQDSAWSQLADEAKAIEAGLPPSPPDPREKEYAPDQARPALTWAGEKLRPAWAGRFIGGKVPYKPRPWIRARMPIFPSRAHVLATGMAAQHGVPPDDAPEPPAADAALAAIGRQLSGKAGGFSCVQCHAIAAKPAEAAFEAPAPNFAYSAERLRKPYYHRWMYNPSRVEPGTRMPMFGDIDGNSPLRDVLDGSAPKQYEAIWHYLLQGNKIEPPAQ